MNYLEVEEWDLRNINGKVEKQKKMIKSFKTFKMCVFYKKKIIKNEGINVNEIYLTISI